MLDGDNVLGGDTPLGAFEDDVAAITGTAAGTLSMSGAAIGDHGISGSAAGDLSMSGEASGEFVGEEVVVHVTSALRGTPRPYLAPIEGTGKGVIRLFGEAKGRHLYVIEGRGAGTLKLIAEGDGHHDDGI